MKRIISLVLALLFIISGLQICFANDEIYYDPSEMDQQLYYFQQQNPQQPIYIPVLVSHPNQYDNEQKDNNPQIIIHNNPNVSTSSSSSGNGIPFKWGLILGGLVYLYFKFGSTILGFISAIPQKFKDLISNFNLRSIQSFIPNIDTTRFSNFFNTLGASISSFLSSTSKFFVNIGDKSLREVIQSSPIF